MLPSVGARAGAGAAAAAAETVYSTAAAQFAAHRQPWSEYLDLLSKQDAEPYPVHDHNPRPAFRGRKFGREGWLFNEQVQLHYRRYPDEHVIASLARWRSGDLVNDIALQQFKGAQPFNLDIADEQGLETPGPEVYAKLNYKNPLTMSRFLTRTGHFFPADILPMHPMAFYRLRKGLIRARQLGLYPKFGNPFWFRTQKFRPKPYKGVYEPGARRNVKTTMEHFSFNWLQTLRVKRHFAAVAAQRKQGGAGTTLAEKQHAGYVPGRAGTFARRAADPPYGPTQTGYAEGNTTVPGLMSTAGMRRNRHLYSKSSKKRMGFPNPMLTTKKI